MFFPVFLFGGGRRTDQTAGRGEGLTSSMTIAWDDAFKRNNLMWKVPRNIRMNDNIVVREDEIAVFYRDGKALAYIDRPDRYALTSQNVAILGWLQKVFTGVVQQAEVYYLQKRIFDGKFGSKEPFIFEDPDFDLIELRTFGEFRYKLGSPEAFINQFVGTFGAATSAEVEERIREEMVKQVYVTLGKMKSAGMKVTQLATNLNEIEQRVLMETKPHFSTLGLEVVQVSGLSIPLPESVKAAVATASAGRILNRNPATGTQQYAFADAMKSAAANPSGGAGAGFGLGAGIGMGYSMAGQMGQMQAPQQVKVCPKCGSQQPTTQKFCGSCGADMTVAPATGKPCIKCGKPVAAGLKFCGECGSPQTLTCPSCKAENPGNLKFCGECGKPLSG